MKFMFLTLITITTLANNSAIEGLDTSIKSEREMVISTDLVSGEIIKAGVINKKIDAVNKKYQNAHYEKWYVANGHTNMKGSTSELINVLFSVPFQNSGQYNYNTSENKYLVPEDGIYLINYCSLVVNGGSTNDSSSRTLLGINVEDISGNQKYFDIAYMKGNGPSGESGGCMSQQYYLLKDEKVSFNVSLGLCPIIQCEIHPTGLFTNFSISMLRPL